MKITQITKTHFEHIYDDMITQFPREELKSREKFDSLLADENYLIYEIKDTGASVGYISFIQTNNCLWIDYLAIYKKYQCLGYGSKIMNLLKREFSFADGIILEVERINPNDINTTRRVGFYKKHGAKLLRCKYLYPNYDFALEMDLYYIPVKKAQIGTNTLKNTIKSVFKILHSDLAHINKVYSEIRF